MKGANMKILVAYDGSPAAEAAVDEVVRRPWPPGSQVLLVTIVDGVLPVTSGVEIYAPVLERLRSSYREEAHARIKRVMERLKGRTDLDANYELRDGTAKKGLLESIRDWEPDLVVVGSRRSIGLSHLFLGSVCHTLINQAPCNVEVIKPPAGSHSQHGSSDSPAEHAA
jgi:nucleotide-binding universal stress UspA family protein